MSKEGNPPQGSPDPSQDPPQPPSPEPSAKPDSQQPTQTEEENITQVLKKFEEGTKKLLEYFKKAEDPDGKYDTKNVKLTLQNLEEKKKTQPEAAGITIHSAYAWMKYLSDKVEKIKWKSFMEWPTKNRTETDVVLDEYRVVLSDGLPGDYIHAAYVDSLNKPKAYIATQAPKMETVVDFWRMVWQTNSRLIVSLTNLKDLDQGHTSCYWPQRPTEVHRYGPVMVRNIAFREQETWVESLLEIAWYGRGLRRRLTHLMYADWDDKRAPSSGRSLSNFRDKMRQAIENPMQIGKAPKNIEIKDPERAKEAESDENKEKGINLLDNEHENH